MEIITVRIKADVRGKYKTIDVLRQIKEFCKNIIFPTKPLIDTCLADLKIGNKKAFKGITEGIPETWNNDFVEYMERDLKLYFE